MEATRCVFNSRKYLAHLWTECTRAVNYVLNRSGTRALNLTTPFEKLYGYQPNLFQLRVLGSTAYVYIPKDKRTKLEHKASKCVLVGYDDQSKAYRLWCPTRRKVILSNNVTVFESIPGNFHSDTPFIDIFMRLLDDDDVLEPPASHPVTQPKFTPMDNDDMGSTPPRSTLTLSDIMTLNGKQLDARNLMPSFKISPGNYWIDPLANTFCTLSGSTRQNQRFIQLEYASRLVSLHVDLSKTLESIIMRRLHL